MGIGKRELPFFGGLVIAASGLVFIVYQQLEIETLRQEVNVLRESARRLSPNAGEKYTSPTTPLEANPCQNTSVASSSIASNQVAPALAKESASSEIPNPGAEKQPDPEAVFRLARIETLVQLNAEQRERLQKKFETEELSPQATTESVENILGPELYAKYQEERKVFREKMRQERLENEIFGLTRKLSLSGEQEQQITQILTQGRAIYFPPEFDWDRDDRNFDRRAYMSERLQREQDRQQYNQAQLRKVLSDEQYNKYLQIQAESPAGRSHQSALAALASPSATP